MATGPIVLNSWIGKYGKKEEFVKRGFDPV